MNTVSLRPITLQINNEHPVHFFSQYRAALIWVMWHGVLRTNEKGKKGGLWSCLFFLPQGSDAWYGDVPAALVSWQWWPGAASPLPLFTTLHMVSKVFFYYINLVYFYTHWLSDYFLLFPPPIFPHRLVVLSVVLFGLPYGSDQSCSVTLVDHGRGYLGILVSCLICESAIMWLSMRGSILYTQPREAVQYVLYIRLGKTHRHTCIKLWILPNAQSYRRWLKNYRLRSKHCLYFVVKWSVVLSSLSLPLSLFSYSVGGACVCSGWYCLACPVLSTLLWHHCQKPGFGWVKANKEANKTWLFSDKGIFILKCELCLWSFAGIVACNWLVIFSVCITLMCTFDPTGRTFVKLKATRRRQRNLTTYTLRY